jgi:hypothetical protein
MVMFAARDLLMLSLLQNALFTFIVLEELPRVAHQERSEQLLD